MKSTKSLGLKLSAAVLAAGVVVSGAATAQAAPTAPATKAVTVKAEKQRTAAQSKNAATSGAIVKALATADTTKEVRDAIKKTTLEASLKSSLDKLLAQLPKDAPKTLRAENDNFGRTPSALVLDVLKAKTASAEAPKCDENTVLQQWAAKLLPLAPEDTEEGANQRGVIAGMSLSGMLNAPTYQAVFLGDTKPALKRFGEEQDKTKVINQAFKDTKAFWDINTGKITASAMKDDIVAGTSKAELRQLSRYSFFSTIPAQLAGPMAGQWFDPRDPFATPIYTKAFEDQFISVVPQLWEHVPFMDEGENAIFTANAFAYMPNPAAPNEKGLPKRFVFGDGLLSFLRVAKFGDTGIKTVIGHEYGHHLQFVMGKDEPEATVPEQTRHSELEADALANYYVGHVKGLNYTKAQRQISIDTGYAIGDCDPTDDGHHGTPLQREAAAKWGIALADTQKKNGHVFAAESVRLKYNKALPDILAAQ